MVVFGEIARADWEGYYKKPRPKPHDPMADWPCRLCKLYPSGKGCKRPIALSGRGKCALYAAWSSRQWRIVTGREGKS